MKNKILAAIVALTVIGVPVLAETNMWTTVENTGGYTAYEQKITVSGYDWSEGLGEVNSCDGSTPWNYPPSLESTAYINEGFENYGKVHMDEAFTSDGQWDLEEYKHIYGEGETNLFKYVDVWTEDSRVNPNGYLWWPTKAWVETEFITETLWSPDSAYFLMNEPRAQDDVVGDIGNHGIFDKVIETDDNFHFYQKVGINDFPSDYEVPEKPIFPEMHWIFQ